ncbi:hypothetical protein QSV36_11460 [Pseudomonas sp. BCRC 81390]|uniref:hypothetical protein n=1 Tax=Pseudomonas sp. BCRC 81390 TaxID=3054778 RepID=UPI002594FB68|nr:hypothetical protein [Pseudomonas sp. BCRC 81390]MDM3886203.1 hypothetical protein [Pseudomonas sp. BCRC 81390]
MKHYFMATFASYDDNEQMSFRTAVAALDEYKVPGSKLRELVAAAPEADLELVCVSYLGQMTEEEFGAR